MFRFCTVLLFCFIFFNAVGEEQFNFNVTEIEIIENGNKFIGKKRGTITSKDNIVITANKFEYDKGLNILNVTGNVEINDRVNDYVIFSEKATYDKKQEKISTEINSKAINSKDNIVITANKFEYDKGLNILNVTGNVEINDRVNDYVIFSEKATYDKKQEKISTEINSKAINSKDNIVITANKFEYDKGLNILNVTGNVEINDRVNDYVIFSEKATYDKKQEKISTEINSKAINSKDNIVITANKFEYDKGLNIILARDNVEIQDKNNNYNLTSDFVKYLKNEGKIFSKGKSRAIDLNDKNEINAKYFEYNIPENTIEAKEKVILENKKKNYKIFTDLAIYNRNTEIINTKGKTSSIFKSKYKFETKNVTLLKKSMEFFSKDKATLTDNSNLYNLSNFRYLANKEIIKGEQIVINSNYKLPSSDKFYFSNGILNLKNQNFIAKDTKIEIHKNIFNNLENDPRIVGVSSVNNNEFSIIKKGVFTSCKKNDGCPPWSIQSNEIKHDKTKREIHYKNALLKLYDIPVLYFPKFYHPDPTVKRKSGFLQPTLNSSNVLGNSFSLPYFYEIKKNSDITIAPTLFDSDNNLIQNEYRSLGKNYNLISNFGHGRDYNSPILKKKKNTTYLFSTLDYNLNLEGFNESKINFNIEKINNDTFLKVFDSTLLDETTSLKPINSNVLNSTLKASLNKNEYSFVTGIEAYETLSLKNSDRFQYILPYYNFNKNIFTNYEYGTFNFNSNGRNDINNTNQLKSEIINDISFSSFDVLSVKGLKNSFNVNLKNINSVGKNIENYKSSPKVELASIFNLQTSYPLQKKTEGELNTLTPKASFLYNPGDMKNHASSKKTIDVNNIFSINRLGLSNTFETGKSLTLGIDYKKELLNDVNKFFGLKIATVYRNKSQNFIPNNTTLK